MEDGYDSGTTRGSKWGCGCGSVVFLATFGAGEFILFFGDCLADAACQKGQGLRWLILLIITGLIAISAGLGLRRLVNRNRRSDS